MRKSRFTEEQIVGVLKEAVAGLKVQDLIRKHGISEHTFCRWQAQYGGLEIRDARKLKQLEDENRRLKTVVADLTLDVQMLKAVTQRKRKRKKRAAGARGVLPPPSQPNERWSMDFMGDRLASGRRFRILNIVDDYSREAVAIAVDSSLPGQRVVRVLERLAHTRPLPTMIVCDNGPEFAGRALDRWATHHGVQLHFIRPGKPGENAVADSLNERMRDECLNEYWSLDRDHARTTIEDLRTDSNEVRPRSALGDRTPTEYA